MGRIVAAVLAGSMLWTILWLSTAQALRAVSPASFTAGGAATAGVSVLFLVASVAYSVAAGYLAATLAPRRPMLAVFALGVLQLALGLYFEITGWSLAPAWYHVVFLVLLLPGNLAGGWIRAGRVVSQRRAA